MALKTIRIGSSANILQYDDVDFDSAVETDQPMKAGAPVDPNDVLRLADLLLLLGLDRLSSNILAGGFLTLHAITNSAHGILIAGANLYSATFRVDNAGNVQLLDSDSGGIIVANADTAGKVCIGRLAPADPVVVYNRTAGTLNFLILLWYN